MKELTQEQYTDLGQYSFQLAKCCDWNELMKRMPQIARKIRDLPSDEAAQEIFAGWRNLPGSATLSRDILNGFPLTIRSVQATMRILLFFEMEFPEPPESIREIVSPD